MGKEDLADVVPAGAPGERPTQSLLDGDAGCCQVAYRGGRKYFKELVSVNNPIANSFVLR